MKRSPVSGYSGTSLARKLGYKEGAVVLARGGPKNYDELIQPLPPLVRFVSRASRRVDMAHVFVVKASELERELVRLRASLRPDVPIWVSWPKKSAKVPADITEDTIRSVALPLGFVDIKVCAVDEVWSDLKLVVRRDLRDG